MNRRDLLKTAAAFSASTMAGRLYAMPAVQTRLLVVFLRGAYDAANVVIPVSSDFYYQSRPTLAIARPGGGADAALALDSDWGLHPALADSLYPLWRKKQIAFVPFAGTDDTSRSHFETQDTIEMGQPINATRDYGSGFMSRIAGVMTGADPMSFTSQVPLSFRGGAIPIPNIALNYNGRPGVTGHDADLIQAMYQGQELAPAVSEGFQVRDAVYQKISAEMQAASRGAVSPKGFEQAGERIGLLMRDKFNLGFVDVGGWDTHVNEGGAQGYLAGRLGELGRGLAAMSNQLGPVWNDSVVIVVSEFGRTFRENGDRGTDHGHGSVYWVMGGKVKGGRIAGEQIAVSEATLFQNRDYPVLNDYRPMIGGVLRTIYGMSPAQIATVFPGVRAADLSLV
jgi:uncharacterized protein (DUF1501 family)